MLNTYKMKMNGVIASEMDAMFFGDEGLITLSQVQEDLKNAGGQDIEVDLSSVGGLVSVGVDIYFAFREYKRTYPSAQMILNMKSQVASMASHIASGEFWDLVTAEDISSWMIHNPAMYVGGDYRVMKEASDHLERLAAMYSTSYKSRSKKSDKEIRSMMDKTTYLFGEEIVKNGFANEILLTAEEKNKPAMIAQMELKYKSVMQKINQSEAFKLDVQNAVAKMQIEEPEKTIIPEKQSTEPAPSGKNNQEDDIVKDITELKDKHPEIHAEAIEAGKSQEKERVKSLLEMKKRKDFEGIQAISDRIDEGIANGESMQSVELGLFALLRKDSIKAEMDSKEIGDIDGGAGENTVSGEKSNDPTAKKAQW